MLWQNSFQGYFTFREYFTKSNKFAKKLQRYFTDSSEHTLVSLLFQAVMIGDDIVSDVGGAQACGIRGIQVRTGKYRFLVQLHAVLQLHLDWFSVSSCHESVECRGVQKTENLFGFGIKNRNIQKLEIQNSVQIVF